jgi:hypothetical protein
MKPSWVNIENRESAFTGRGIITEISIIPDCHNVRAASIGHEIGHLARQSRQADAFIFIDIEEYWAELSLADIFADSH